MPTIRSSRVVVGEELRPATIRYESGQIVDVFDGPADKDMGDLIIMPGLVDSHVHVNEPGRTQWEGFRTATLAAAAGGTTTIVDMPLNSVPPTVDHDALEAKRRSAHGAISVDVAFWGGVIPGSEGHIPTMVQQGVSGFKMFMVDSGVAEFPPLGLPSMRGILETLAGEGVPALVHAESADHLGEIDQTSSYQSYLSSRPVESEVAAVTELSGLAGETGAAVHVLHVSSADAAGIIGGGPLGGETCPHYLTFAAEQIADGSTLFKCAPPIREAAHREGLWEALGSGAISMIVSDHSPAPPELKAQATGDFLAAWGGISSLQLRLPATWTGASARGYGPVALARWLSTEPARLSGLSQKGSIEQGSDADLVVFDPDARVEVRGSDLYHRHPITPYEGMTLRGRVVETILRGEVVFDGKPRSGYGRMLARDD
ncbi:MAG: allantoinase AllB [Acidimicrobiia bacterium]|nr:allantoinase AllB [Acidimicrobiia bacterium]